MFFISMFFETMSLVSLIPLFKILSSDININEVVNLYSPFSKSFNFTYNQWIVISSLVIGGIFTFKAFFLSFFSFKLQQLVNKLKTHYPNLLFEKYLGKNYRFHLNHNSSYLIRNVTETEGIATYLKSLIIFTHEILIFVSLIFILLFYSPLATLILLGTLLPTTLVFFVIIKKKSKKWGEERILNLGKRFKNLQEGLRGIKDIKIFKKENEFQKNFNTNTKLMNIAEMKQYFIESLPRLWLEWLLVIAFLILISFSLIILDDKHDIFTLIVLFAMAGYRAMPSLVRILQSHQAINYIKPILNLVINDLTEQEKLQKSSQIADKGFKDNLIIKDFNFNYDSKIIFKNLNFRIKKGSAIGIVGESGAGKTTFVNLLLGLLKPSEGKILLDQKEITNDLYHFPNLFGHVPQDLFLLDSSIKNNVAFTLDESNIDKRRVRDVLKKSKLDIFVDNCENGLDTNIGEQGVKLSGGQKQRLGIARALYLNSKILIFDEATSALDIETEKEIVSELIKLKNIMTILIISHRQTTLSFCEEIYKIENNNIKKI